MEEESDGKYSLSSEESEEEDEDDSSLSKEESSEEDEDESEEDEGESEEDEEDTGFMRSCFSFSFFCRFLRLDSTSVENSFLAIV